MKSLLFCGKSKCTWTIFLQFILPLLSCNIHFCLSLHHSIYYCMSLFTFTATHLHGFVYIFWVHFLSSQLFSGPLQELPYHLSLPLHWGCSYPHHQWHPYCQSQESILCHLRHTLSRIWHNWSLFLLHHFFSFNSMVSHSSDPYPALLGTPS